jgi:hypothetical protein
LSRLTLFAIIDRALSADRLPGTMKERYSLPWLHKGMRLSPPAMLLFFLIVPALLGCMLGATRAGVALYFPWGIGLLFWTVSSVGVWGCLFVGSTLVAAALRRWQLPLWLVLSAGAVLGSLPGRYFVFSVAGALGDHMFPGRVPQTAPPFEMSVGFAAYFLQGWAGVYLIWIVASVLFDRWLASQVEPVAGGVDPIRHSARAECHVPLGSVGFNSHHAADWDPKGADPSASLLDRLPRHIGRDVVALEAEDHYVRVHTTVGSSLIFARFGDAMTALSALDGVRVHRSYWVRRAAVQGVSVQGKGLMLTLSNDMRVPVSHGFREVARDAGITPPSGRGPPPLGSRVPPAIRAKAT